METFAPLAKRIVELTSSDCKEHLQLQLEVCTHCTKCPATVAERARRAASFFEDMHGRHWPMFGLSEWQVAMWVQSKVTARSKTARRTALSTLSFLERVLDQHYHSKSTLVTSQGSCTTNPKCLEPPVPAAPPSCEIVGRLEHLIDSASTIIERILAGFFCCLTYSCCRCSDLLTTRK